MTTDQGRLFDDAKSAIEAVATPGGGYPLLNESETRAHLIDPIVRALGYRTLDQVRREYRLEASGQYVDYLLVADDARVVVEAKSLSGELSAKDASQLVGYCAMEGIRWALLTNGRVWQVFDVEVKGNWQAKRIATLDLWAAHAQNKLGATVAGLGYFARTTLLGGDGDLQAWARGERARTCLDTLLSNPASAVVQAVLQEMTKVGIELEPSEAVQLLRSGTVSHADEVPPLPPPDLNGAPPGAASSPAANKYVVFPVADEGGYTATQQLQKWLSANTWGLRSSTPNRKRLAAGDRCCFYVPKVGIVAHAVITGPANYALTPGEWPGPGPFSPDIFAVPLASVAWLTPPLALDATLRAKLDAFKGKDQSKPWGWLIQTTNQLTAHDFELMTGGAPAG